ncbi:MAG TPA: isochorismatase family protein [Byssovorax sp.]
MSVARPDPASSAVVVVDVQDKLAAAMPADAMAELTRAATILLEACAALGVRAIATEQYKKGLGATITPIAAKLGELAVTPIEKLCFSVADSPDFERALAATNASTIVVLGMEAHVCVFQSVRDLVAQGRRVLVPIDGVASRRADHRAAGLELCKAAGATLTTAETLAFDWLRVAGTEPFKRLSRVIR